MAPPGDYRTNVRVAAWTLALFGLAAFAMPFLIPAEWPLALAGGLPGLVVALMAAPTALRARPRVARVRPMAAFHVLLGAWIVVHGVFFGATAAYLLGQAVAGLGVILAAGYEEWVVSGRGVGRARRWRGA